MDAIASYDPVFEVEDSPATLESYLDPYRSVRIRVWNTKTDDGRRTNVRPEEAQAAVELINVALSQCELEHPMAAVYQSLGTLMIPAQCFEPKLVPGSLSSPVLSGPFEECTCGRFLFGHECLWPTPILGDLGDIGERINNIPLGDRDGLVGVDEPGEIDLVFVTEFLQDVVYHFGISRPNGGRTVMLSEQLLRANPGSYLLLVAHEVGHSFGGYPEVGLGWTFGWDLDYYSPWCFDGGFAVPAEERHVMCEKGVAGVFVDPLSCAYWHATIESKRGPRNYAELCDAIDNDLDGSTDEDDVCL